MLWWVSGRLEDTLRLLPPYVIAEADLLEGLAAIDHTLSEMELEA